MQEVNPNLKEYIEKNIFPIYEKNDLGHQLDHILYVIERSFHLSKDFDLNPNMIYTIAAYHDCAHYIDRLQHEKLGAQILFQDEQLRQFFSEEEILIMKEAVEDHRSCLDHEPRSIYGKIVSSADRNTNVKKELERAYWYSLKHYPNFNQTEHIERCYQYIEEKFGIHGYAKCDIKDDIYTTFVEDLRSLLSNPNLFQEMIHLIEKETMEHQS